MFSYNTPRWKYKLNTRILSIMLTLLYVASIVPMLIIGLYDWPSADDFSMALEPHQYYMAGGSFIGTLGAAFTKTVKLYNTWVGYFFSSFVTCICPSVFGERFYIIVPFVILGVITWGVCYFYRALFISAWKLDRHLTNSVSMLTLLVIVNSMENGTARSEAFYWYSGAINYSFMFGLSLLWIGLVIRLVYDDSAKSRRRKLILACVLGFLLGGANYMSALGLAICSGLIIFIFIMVRAGKFSLLVTEDEQRKSFGYIWIPAVLNIVGLIVSALAPGNSIREAQAGSFGAAKSVLVSIYYVFDLCISDMTRWEVFGAVLVVSMIGWKLADGMKNRLEHPFLFVLFTFLYTASAMVPPLFAVGNIDAGRIHSLVWMEYVVMLVLCTLYMTIWFKQHLNLTGSEYFSERHTLMIVIITGFIAMGSMLCVYVDPYYYTVTSAVYDLVTGNARTYYEENVDRLELLQDKSATEVVFDEYTYQPELLFYQDVTTDSAEWTNEVVATYYGKASVCHR